MAAVPGLGAFLGLRRSVARQLSFGLVSLQSASACPLKRLCTTTKQSNELELPVNPENQSLLDNLNLMGVDVRMACQRQPGVFRKIFTNEQGVAEFLQGKGASRKVIASIISRYPRAITRSVDHLEQRWTLWRNVFKADAEIVSILERSPESFFRSSDNENLELNINFLISLGLNNKDLNRLLTTAPRTFSNSLALNKQMVEFLEDTCTDLGGNNPEQFVKSVISRNLYILIRSTKRVKTNIDNLKASLKLKDSELLALLEGHGAKILDLSNEYMKKSFTCLHQKLSALGCRNTDIKKLIFNYPMILYIGPDTLSTKLDCLLKGGITVEQIIEKPKVLDYSTQNITARLEELQRLKYNFQEKGITILDSSHKRFSAKIEKLSAAAEE